MQKKKAAMIFPYYPEPPQKPEDTFHKFILVLLFPDFIEKFYKNIIHIKKGTLYILDQFDNIIACNHPCSSDYYEYDEIKKTYVLKNDDPDPPEDNMSFKEYKLLNTDNNILNITMIKELLSKLNINYIENMDEKNNIFTTWHTIVFNKIKYMTVVEYSKNSQCKLIYFHPIPQIHKPIYNIITIIFYITFFIILIVVFLSLIVSKIFTEPIKNLVITAENISGGNLKTLVDTKKFYGEFLTLGTSFNYMIKTINQYNEHLEEMVKQRTEELAKANSQIKRELEMAQRIQQAIIPKVFPKVSMLNIYGFYQPMEDLGGDFYDVFMLDKNKIVFMIVDVCGHGVSAALVTAMAKVSFFNNSRKDLLPSEIVSIVNQEICNIIGENNSYFTVFYAIFDINTKILEYTNAGHNDIYVLKKNREIVSLPSNSPFVGMMKILKYKSSKVELEEDDKIILYTDGIPEMRNYKKELFGDMRFKECIIKYSDLSIEKMVENIITEVNNFRQGFRVSDDVTILVIHILKDTIEINIHVNNIKEKIIEEIKEAEHDNYMVLKQELINAINYFNEGKYKESIEILSPMEHAFQRKRDKFFVFYLLGCNYYKLQDIKNAIKFLSQAKKMNNYNNLTNFINILKKV